MVREEVMRKYGLMLLDSQAFFDLRWSQQTQPAQPQPAQNPLQPHAECEFDVGNVPTPTDMYCSGFITTEKVPDKLFVAADRTARIRPAMPAL